MFPSTKLKISLKSCKPVGKEFLIAILKNSHVPEINSVSSHSTTTTRRLDEDFNLGNLKIKKIKKWNNFCSFPR